MRVLAVESSCDETSASVVEWKDGKFSVLSLVVRSQAIHEKFGGVVPELAARSHIEIIHTVVDMAIQDAGLSPWDMDLIAATKGPGLAAALIVGVEFAKTLSLALKLPFVGVNHLIGHIYSAYLSDPHLRPPFLTLIASGGHTELVWVKDWYGFDLLGHTLDDAAGEAFDKGGRMLGLPYPAGPHIDRLARTGDRDFHTFPRPKIKRKGYFFSFSGLKTALLNYIRHHTGDFIRRHINDIAASYQEAIVLHLLEVTRRAWEDLGTPPLAVVGGVALNSRLREVFRMSFGGKVIFALPQYCGDNAAMIGAAALRKYDLFGNDGQEVSVYPSLGVVEP
ncbi:MAG: tRNA (adenosine(37)-N6)-threonylcarbamoyltransferase complex transferase subunit TsaD [Thermotogae bacterium]|nr:tRNA (adenosine(37)-N6)-threonylcarbamoyltransferase complex transferase subunit TsaD [Thermotogota bacterium]